MTAMIRLAVGRHSTPHYVPVRDISSENLQRLQDLKEGVGPLKGLRLFNLGGQVPFISPLSANMAERPVRWDYGQHCPSQRHEEFEAWARSQRRKDVLVTVKESSGKIHHFQFSPIKRELRFWNARRTSHVMVDSTSFKCAATGVERTYGVWWRMAKEHYGKLFPGCKVERKFV